MYPFGYARVQRADEAVHVAAQSDVSYIAGGTELLNWMRLGIAELARVLDIGRVGEMRGITRDGDALIIGALSTLNEIGEHALVLEHAPVLSQACLKAASAQIRNRATLGGNLLQKTRCAYFRAEPPLPWPCNKRAPGSGCSALDGPHERIAIFGWTEACVATQPSDPAVALACLDAEISVSGSQGKRVIKASDFHVTPEIVRAEAKPGSRLSTPHGLMPLEREAHMENRLSPGDLITSFRIPISALSRRSMYLKVRERESYEYAMISAAVALDLDGSRIKTARVALGSVAHKPWRLEKAERALAGQTVERAALVAAVSDAMRDARPLAHNGFKVTLATNAAVRALESLLHDRSAA
jgi:xanthine dehydrogenase YagS FAD-binding subunit